MKYLRYGYFFLKKGIILNILLVFQILISILSLNLTIGRYNMQYQSLHLFSPLAQYKGVYYMPASPFEHIPDQDEQPEEHKRLDPDYDALKKVQNVASISKIAFYDTAAKKYYSTVVYPDFLVDMLPDFFDKNLWKPSDSTSVPLVMVGSLYGKGYTSGEVLIYGSQFEGETPAYCSVDIRGLANTGNKYFVFASSGNISCLDLFQTHNDRYKEFPLFLTRQSAIAPYNAYTLDSYSSKLIVFDEDISEEEYQFNIDELNKTGTIMSFEELYNEGKARTKSDTTSLMALTICILAVTIIGMISLIVLNTLRLMPTFAVYYICGCKWNKCVYIILSYLLYIIIMVGIGALLFCSYMVAEDMLFEMQILIKANNILFTIFMLLLLAVCSVVPAYISFKTKSPIKILHEKDQ